MTDTLIKVVLKNRDAFLYRAGFAQGKAQAVNDLTGLAREYWLQYARDAQVEAAREMTRIQRPSFWRRVRGVMIAMRRAWSSSVPTKGKSCEPSLTPRIK